jgi:DNA-directed RNA polymerase specialized sigma24 family protein
MNELQTSHLLDMGSKQSESRSDSQLMSAVAEGDRTALEQLYDRHISRCFGLAVHIVRESSIAEDVVQEVFVKLWSRPGSYCPECGHFDTWLLTAVGYLALGKLRCGKSRPEFHTIGMGAESTSPETIVDTLPDTRPTPKGR